MRKLVYTFMSSGFLMLLVGGFWGLILSLRVLVELGGFWLAVAGFVLFPVLFAFAPFYSGIALNDWSILKITYGTWAVAAILLTVGVKISGD